MDVALSNGCSPQPELDPNHGFDLEEIQEVIDGLVEQVEHLVALRAIPGLVVLRPADANETTAAWRTALARRDGPTALALTRQTVPALPAPPAGAVARGAYVRADGDDVVLVATGSEVHVALAARDRLAAPTPARLRSRRPLPHPPLVRARGAGASGREPARRDETHDRPGDPSRHRPSNEGSRLSTNARIASAVSRVLKFTACACASASSACDSETWAL